MGLGDNLMATGMARGAKERGETIAFGDGQRLIWDHNSETIFLNNPNIARPGHDLSRARWINFYKGNRLYNVQDHARERWVWNMEFRATPGEMFLEPDELKFAKRYGAGFVLIEPNVPDKLTGPNKLWPLDRYQRLGEWLKRDGYEVVQFEYPGIRRALRGVRMLQVKGFRQALSVLRNARLVICCEGGLHHGAAAMGRPAVVLFGGFVPPQVTGYDTHENIAVGEACGRYMPCDHCRAAMDAISLDEVYVRARKLLC